MSFLETLRNTHKPYPLTVTEQKEERKRERWEEPSRKKNLQACGKLRKEKDRRERERGGKQAAYSRYPIEQPFTKKKKKKKLLSTPSKLQLFL